MQLLQQLGAAAGLHAACEARVRRRLLVKHGVTLSVGRAASKPASRPAFVRVRVCCGPSHTGLCGFFFLEDALNAASHLVRQQRSDPTTLCELWFNAWGEAACVCV